MRKAALLGVTLVVPLIVATIILILEADRPADWRVELGQYILYRNTHADESISIQEIVEAHRPWHFDSEMSDTVFGDSVFRTDNRYNGQRGGYITLPFPPEQLYCVLLEGDDRLELAFVALHNDQVWWQDWLVHQSSTAVGTAAFEETMSRLGCELDLGIK